MSFKNKNLNGNKVSDENGSNNVYSSNLIRYDLNSFNLKNGSEISQYSNNLLLEENSSIRKELKEYNSNLLVNPVVVGKKKNVLKFIDDEANELNSDKKYLSVSDEDSHKGEESLKEMQHIKIKKDSDGTTNTGSNLKSSILRSKSIIKEEEEKQDYGSVNSNKNFLDTNKQRDSSCNFTNKNKRRTFNVGNLPKMSLSIDFINDVKKELMSPENEFVTEEYFMKIRNDEILCCFMATIGILSSYMSRDFCYPRENNDCSALSKNIPMAISLHVTTIINMIFSKKILSFSHLLHFKVY